MFVTQAWYMAAWSAEVTGEPLGRRIINEPLVLFRTDEGEVIALEDRCCHRGFPLAHGKVIGRNIQCGYHGLEFNGRGECVRVPGQDLIPPNARVRSYPVVERDEIIWVWMSKTAPADETKIVPYPFNNDREQWPHKATTYHLKCNYQLIIDNLLDLTHLGFVHGSTIGGNPDAHVTAEMKTKRTANGVHLIRWLLNSIPPPTYVEGAGFKGRVDRWMDFEYVAPGTIIQFTGALDAGTGAYDQGKRDGGFALRVFHGITPETEHTSHYFWCASNGYRQDEPEVTEKLFRQVSTAFKEDEFVLERQYQRLTELADRQYIDINADVARIQARRAIERLISAENLRP